MIKVENLNKSFDGVQVLKDISVTYEPGKCNMIIGASGSGKTVLLKNLIGLMEPDSGEISYGEHKLSEMSDKEKMKLRQNIGILFQGSALFDFATVIENVMFPMEFFTDWSAAQRKERAQYCLEKVNVIGSDDKYPNELSGGEQQRVAIARAIVNEPSILLADEPTGNLDPANSWEIMKLLDDANKRGTTVVVVTHNHEIVSAMKKRVITMQQGNIVSDTKGAGV